MVASPIRRGASPFENGDGGNPILGEMRLCSRLTGKFSDRVLESLFDPYSPNVGEKLSKKSGQPQNERLEAYQTEQRGLISLRYDRDFCA